jgi:Flp pilus assembly protein TadG
MPIKHPAHERGANLVEAALVIPLLLIILVGVVDMGRAYFSYITIINAAREGARYGVKPLTGTTNLPTQGQVETMAEAEAQDLTNLGMTPDCVASSNTAPGTAKVVTCQVDFHLILGGIIYTGIPPFTIRYKVEFPIRCDGVLC